MLAAVLAVVPAACSAPSTAAGTIESAEQRVLELVTDTAAALPLDEEPAPPERTGLVRCRRTFLGYTIGSTGAHRVEVPMLIELPEGSDARTLLDDVERSWTEQGFAIDDSDRDDDRFPKLRASVDGYEIVATAMVERAQLNLYAISPCVRA